MSPTFPKIEINSHLQADLLTLTATLSTALHGWVNTTNDVNFTYGFTFTVGDMQICIILQLEHDFLK